MPSKPLDSSVLCPADLSSCPATGQLFRVGGRVEQVDGNRVLLADATAMVAVDFAGSAPIPPQIKQGDLLLVGGAWLASGIAVKDVELFVACPESTGDGQWARFRWGQGAKRLRLRQAIEERARNWFKENGFVEVRTPTLLDAPGLDSGVDALQAQGGYLVTSPELHLKRMLVGGMPRVFELATCFRREELGPRHQPAFVMLEWYRAFCDLEQILEDTEGVITRLAEQCGLGPCVMVDGRAISLKRPFLRLTVEEAFRRHAGVHHVHDLANDAQDEYFEVLVNQVEPALAAYEVPVFLTHYPASQAALARLCKDDARSAERAELYLGGIELCNAYGELSGAVEQRQRFEAELEARRQQGRDAYPLDEPFLAALVEGMPPSAGNAMGLDRLVAILLGLDDIADVVAFPRRLP